MIESMIAAIYCLNNGHFDFIYPDTVHKDLIYVWTTESISCYRAVIHRSVPLNLYTACQCRDCPVMHAIFSHLVVCSIAAFKAFLWLGMTVFFFIIIIILFYYAQAIRLLHVPHSAYLTSGTLERRSLVLQISLWYQTPFSPGGGLISNTVPL